MKFCFELTQVFAFQAQKRSFPLIALMITCACCSFASIGFVSTISTQQLQTIVISGTGFGTKSAYTGNSSYISFLDVTKNWQAGFSGPCPAALNGCEGAASVDDALFLMVESWSDSSIVLGGFSGPWGSNGFGCTPACDLGVGDSVQIIVWNAQTGIEAGSITVVVRAQGLADTSYLSVNAPANCGTADNATVTAAQIGGSGTGFACMKTMVFPQIAIGSGWTTQLITVLPTETVSSSLVGGPSVPGYAYTVTPGWQAQVTLSGSSTPVPFYMAESGCVGLWVNNQSLYLPVSYLPAGVRDAGTERHSDFTSLANIGGCGAFSASSLNAGFAQGPLQMQIFAPDATTLSEAIAQISYFYSSPTVGWQVTVNPVDINNAKTKWTAPLFQGDIYNYVTAFSVVNASGGAQTATITLRDKNGAPLGTPFTTPSLAPGCGCNQLNQSAVGGFYANTVSSLFPNLGTQDGSIEFDGNSGNIVVLVLRTVNNTLASVPAE